MACLPDAVRRYTPRSARSNQPYTLRSRIRPASGAIAFSPAWPPEPLSPHGAGLPRRGVPRRHPGAHRHAAAPEPIYGGVPGAGDLAPWVADGGSIQPSESNHQTGSFERSTCCPHKGWGIYRGKRGIFRGTPTPNQGVGEVIPGDLSSKLIIGSLVAILVAASIKPPETFGKI